MNSTEAMGRGVFCVADLLQICSAMTLAVIGSPVLACPAGTKIGSTKLVPAVHAALVLTVFTALLFAARPVHAQTETLLYGFAGAPSDGNQPYAGVVMDKKGNLWGTTLNGGTSNDGTVFELTPSGGEWNESSLISVGGYPFASLIDEKGNLYGTTSAGGNGSGSVFMVNSKKHTVTTLYNFCSEPGCADGGSPVGGVVMDKAGNLYGTTLDTVFKLTPSGTLTQLYIFCSQPGCADGYAPYAGVVMDKEGNFYGTTDSGGAYGNGTVFEVTQAGTETVLYSFTTGTDGAQPRAGLVFDSKGHLYGTTEGGGLNNCSGSSGCGTVFELSPEVGDSCPSGTNQGNGWCEAILHTFMSGSDGANPYGGLILDKKGNLYGTTAFGGNGWAGFGGGTVFELAKPTKKGGSWTETVLCNFVNGEGGPYGASPTSTLIWDAEGNLYGTTQSGGKYPGIYGVVFELTP